MGIGKSLDQKLIRETFDALFVSDSELADTTDTPVPRSANQKGRTQDDGERRMHPLFGQVTIGELRNHLPNHDVDAIWSKMAKLNLQASSQEQPAGQTSSIQSLMRMAGL